MQATLSNFGYFISVLTQGGFLTTASSPFSEGIIMMSDITIFVPNSQTALDTLTSLTAEPKPENLNDVLKYHLGSTVQYGEDLQNGKTIKTLQGDDVTIHISPDGTKYVNGIRIISTDNLIANGVAHVIDG